MPIETHTRTKIEVIIDQPHLSNVTRVLDRHGVAGYSVFESVAGKGSRGRWTQARLTDADDRVLVLTVVDSDTADALLEKLSNLFEELPGVVFASDVRVLRANRF